MSVQCERTSCKHNEASRVFYSDNRFCRRGGGYDYGGGDIMVSKHGYCTCFEKQPPKRILSGGSDAPST